ncbi:carboxypeptidase-like regulatory domain-containing protein [Chitinophaga pinensis]|uniref:carboxypeptidase-like regulatory domain-containing protein n=1 Tax=Chitinophaga pinensis TaxID=79329 RepID=UPI001C99FCD1|nr:carboxypeptidase-like regulatory domain-containing protein [Chitinophaga pinensis]
MKITKRGFHGIIYLIVALLAGLSASAQQTVRGTLRSAAGEAIPGATIAVKKAGTVAIADSAGHFSIKALTGDTLVVSFVGFKRQEVRVPSSLSLNIILQESVSTLSDVVVIGYGTRAQKDLTGSIATVSSKDFQQGAITTPDQLVTGKVAGVVITPNSGAPGAGGTIRIREVLLSMRVTTR